jgi:hypothetical protein
LVDKHDNEDDDPDNGRRFYLKIFH